MRAKITFSILLLIFSMGSFAQIRFASGYIIDNNNRRTDCLIKNSDWNDNPQTFKYQLTESSEIQEGTLTNTKEFGVEDLTYKRFAASIDQVNPNDNLDNNPVMVLQSKTLFLKQVVTGKASLYKYVNNKQIRFFYTIDGSEIRLLEYKEYLVSNNKIAKNLRYRQELLNNLRCEKIARSSIENLGYDEQSLSAIFKKYNSCFETEKAAVSETVKAKSLFNLKIRPGVTSSSFELAIEGDDLYYQDTHVDFGNKTGFRIGLEAEIILPFAKNTWSIFVEPTYQGYKSEVATDSKKATIDLQSIELSVGIRHYFFLNNDSKIFANVAFEGDIPVKKDAFYPRASYSTPFQVQPSPNLSFGLGYNYSKFSIEARYETTRNYINRGLKWTGEYNLFAVILGYKIL